MGADTTYLRQLALGLKVDGDVSGLLKFDQKLKMFVANLTTSAPWKMIDSIGRAMTELSVSAAQDAVQLDLRAKALRTTTQELQRLEYIAGSAGVANPLEKVTALLQRLRGLETSAGTTAGGGAAGGLLGALGLKRGMDPVQKIQAIATNLQKLPPTLRDLAKQQLGTDELQHLLELGPEQMQRLSEEADNLGLVWGGETVQAGRKLEGQLFQLRAMQTGLTRQLQADLVPIALRVVGIFRAWAPVILDLAKRVLASFGVSTGTAADAQKDLKKRLEEAQDAAGKFGEKLDDVAAVVAAVITALKILIEALLIRAVVARAVASLALLNGATMAATASMVAMSVASGLVTGGIGLILVELNELWAFMEDKPNMWSDMLEDPDNLGGRYLKWLGSVQEDLSDMWDWLAKIANITGDLFGIGRLTKSDEEKRVEVIDAQLAGGNLPARNRAQLQAQRAELIREMSAGGQDISRFERALPTTTSGGPVNVTVGGVNQNVQVNGAQSPGATADQIMAAQRAAQEQQAREAATRLAPVYKR